MVNNISLIKKIIKNHVDLIQSFDESLISKINEASQKITFCLRKNNKILLCGNGGSAADAQHISAELVGRFVKERRPLPSIALTVDTSAITAIGNDYSFENIFDRQVDALASEGDILIAISTSGNSKNVLNAIQKAKDKNCLTIAMTGYDGGKMKSISDININIDINNTARIQEAHILIAHIICEIVDENIDKN